MLFDDVSARREKAERLFIEVERQIRQIAEMDAFFARVGELM